MYGLKLFENSIERYKAKLSIVITAILAAPPNAIDTLPIRGGGGGWILSSSESSVKRMEKCFKCRRLTENVRIPSDRLSFDDRPDVSYRFLSLEYCLWRLSFGERDRDRRSYLLRL